VRIWPHGIKVGGCEYNLHEVNGNSSLLLCEIGMEGTAQIT
jgi:hypothetical protein